MEPYAKQYSPKQSNRALRQAIELFSIELYSPLCYSIIPCWRTPITKPVIWYASQSFISSLML